MASQSTPLSPPYKPLLFSLENFQNILKINGKYQETPCKAAAERKQKLRNFQMIKRKHSLPNQP